MSALLLVLLLVLIAINGVFVAAEFALVRSRRSRLEQLASEGSKRASLVLIELDEIDEYLSACQVGITIASIGIGALIEPSLATLIKPIFGGLAHGVAVTLSGAIAVILATAHQTSVGVQVPKLVAISRPEATARLLATPLRVFRRLSAPFTVGLTWIVNAIVRLFGVRP